MKRLTLITAAVLFLVSITYAQAETIGPVAYLTEQSIAHYTTNGTLGSLTFLPSPNPCSANPCRYGFFEVSVPNETSVLQAVRVNLTPQDANPIPPRIITGTNILLRNDSTAYAGAVASASAPHVRVKIFVDTVQFGSLWGNQSNYYNISDDVSFPAVRMNLTYANLLGGTEIYDNASFPNIFNPFSPTAPAANNLTFVLNITNPSTKTINTINIRVQFSRDTNGVNDIVNVQLGPGGIQPVSEVGSGSPGTAARVNSDGGDNDFDAVTVTGASIAAGHSLTLRFNASIAEGTNIVTFDTNGVNLDNIFGDNGPVDDKGATFNSTDTTGAINLKTIPANQYFARSSVSQGIELFQNPAGTDPESSKWSVRAFIENKDQAGGTALVYNVTNWGIYEIDPLTGRPAPPTSRQNGTFSNTSLTNFYGKLYTTDRARSSNTSIHPTGSTLKPFYAGEFVWSVVWNETARYTFGHINATLDLPLLYNLEMQNDVEHRGFVTANIPTNFSVFQSVVKQGSHKDNSNVSRIEIHSNVPLNTTTNLFHGVFDVSNATIYLGNGSYPCTDPKTDVSNCLDITGRVLAAGGIRGTISPVNDSTGQRIGLVFVRIPDINSVIGYNMTNLDKIVLRYNIRSNESMVTGDGYNFTGNATFVSKSGTPYTANVSKPDTVQVGAKRLIGFKELIARDPFRPTLVNVTFEIRVETGTEPANDNITGIQWLDYIPLGAAGNVTKVVVRRWNATGAQAGMNILEEGIGWNRTNKSTAILPDGTNVTIINYTDGGGGGFTLYNGDYINVTYTMNITQPGLYNLPTIIAAFDPRTGESLGTGFIGRIRVEVQAPLLPLQVEDEPLTVAKRAVVFKPVLWSKRFEVFNPNDRIATGKFETEVFVDTMEGFVSYIDFSGNKIDEGVSFEKRGDKKYMVWESRINPLESRIYDVTVLTPPVVEIDRDVEVLEEVENKKVRIKLDVFLKNLAQETYQNVVLNVPIGFESIEKVTDSFGNIMAFTGGADSSSVTIPEIEGNGIKTASIIYKESFPAIIITPDKDSYALNSPVGLDVLIINGGEKLDHPAIEIEVYDPNYNLIFADIRELKTLNALEKTQIFQRFNLPAIAPDGFYIVIARFREGGEILTTFSGNFYVAGIGGGFVGLGTIEFVIVVAIALVLLYFSFARLREARRRR